MYLFESGVYLNLSNILLIQSILWLDEEEQITGYAQAITDTFTAGLVAYHLALMGAEIKCLFLCE